MHTGTYLRIIPTCIIYVLTGMRVTCPIGEQFEFICCDISSKTQPRARRSKVTLIIIIRSSTAANAFGGLLFWKGKKKRQTGTHKSPSALQPVITCVVRALCLYVCTHTRLIPVCNVGWKYVPMYTVKVSIFESFEGKKIYAKQNHKVCRQYIYKIANGLQYLLFILVVNLWNILRCTTPMCEIEIVV